MAVCGAAGHAHAISLYTSPWLARRASGRGEIRKGTATAGPTFSCPVGKVLLFGLKLFSAASREAEEGRERKEKALLAQERISCVFRRKAAGEGNRKRRSGSFKLFDMYIAAHLHGGDFTF